MEKIIVFVSQSLCLSLSLSLCLCVCVCVHVSVIAWKKIYQNANSCFFLKIIYLWLCWIFVAVCGLFSSCGEWGYSSFWCAGFSWQWSVLAQALRAWASVVAAGGLRVAAGGLSCTCGL